MLVLLELASGCVIHTTSAEPDGYRRPRRRRRARRRASRAPAPRAQPAPAAAPPNVATTRAKVPRRLPPASKTRPILLPEGSGIGRPGGFRPAAPAAFWVWQGPRGNWRLRTTTAGRRHSFRGRVASVTGRIVNVKPTQFEMRDRVWPAGGGYAFDFKTKGHADGFVFAVSGNGCVRFDLRLDGGPVAKRIVVGRRQINPSQAHFIVCPPGVKPGR